MEQKAYQIFCANEQTETPHTATIDGNGEWVFTCTTCGRSIKFPASMTAEDIKKAVEAHKEANTGQITQASIDEKLQELNL